MEASVKKQNLTREFPTPENCFITELSNSPDDPHASMARARVEPGKATRRHRLLGTAERYYIVSGRGRVEVGSLPPEEVTPGDVVLIPPMCPQRITNTGPEDLVFLAVCTPPFRDEVYVDMEEDPAQGG